MAVAGASWQDRATTGFRPTEGAGLGQRQPCDVHIAVSDGGGAIDASAGCTGTSASQPARSLRRNGAMGWTVGALPRDVNVGLRTPAAGLRKRP